MDKMNFEFHGKPGNYFVVFLVTAITSYIPIFGWPIAMNYGLAWIADNTTIGGKQIKYSAGYGETLKFLLLNMLLLIVTLGIYVFWFVPKQYRFIAAHTSFVE
jgi:Bacterial protein of unknown function (DUF898).